MCPAKRLAKRAVLLLWAGLTCRDAVRDEVGKERLLPLRRISQGAGKSGALPLRQRQRQDAESSAFPNPFYS